MNVSVELINKLTKSNIQKFGDINVGDFKHIAINDNYILVGDVDHVSDGVLTGTAYLYNINGDLVNQFTPVDLVSDGEFGRAVSIENDVIAITSAHHTPGIYSGTCYVYSVDGDAITTISSGEDYDNFGSSVLIKDGAIIISAVDDGIVKPEPEPEPEPEPVTSDNQYSVTLSSGSSNGITLTNPDEVKVVVMSFDPVTYDNSVPTDVMFISVDGITIKLDFAGEYTNKPFDVTTDGKRFVGVIDVNSDYSNPTVINEG